MEVSAEYISHLTKENVVWFAKSNRRGVRCDSLEWPHGGGGLAPTNAGLAPLALCFDNIHTGNIFVLKMHRGITVPLLPS